MKFPKTDIPFEFEGMIDGLWELDIKNDKVYLGPDASKLFGHKRAVTLRSEEVLSRSIHEEYVDRLQYEIGLLLRNKIEMIETEIKLKPSLNEWRWVQLRAKAISWETNGSPNRLLGSVTDISKCKEAEEEIKNERKILRSIIDNLPVSIYVMDREGRKILANKTDCEFMGASEESEVLGKTDLELFSGKTGDRGHKDNMYVINNIQPILNREEVFFDKKGNPKWLLTSKIPLFNDDNQVSGLLGIGIDITEQKSLQQKISESETFYRTLINTTPNGVIITDMAGNITFITTRAYQIFKIPEGENQIGKPIFSLVAPGSLADAEADFLEMVEGKRPLISEEYKCLNNEKTEFWVEVASSLLLDVTGTRIGIMTVGHDVTDRKKTEEDLVSAKNKAEENDRLKTAFLNNISHEIRTPLNSIVGFSSLLNDMNLSRDKQKSYIEIINKGSDQLLKIIGDILDISKIEAGVVNVDEGELDLNNLIEDLFNRFNPESERKKIQLKYVFGIREEKVIIRSDRTMLFRILSNLLSNSLKFTDTGIIEYGYSVVDNNIRFYVSDTGPGIPQNKFHKIFDRFYQAEHPLNKLNEGTGLGLAICKAYLNSLGGRIWLTSKVGKGTTFYFTIPLNRN